MHRALPVPAPHLLRHEGQVGGQQAHHRVDHQGQGGARRRRRRPVPGALAVVGALLHQLQVVVAERPEERLRDLQGARVVVGGQGVGRLGDHPGQLRQHGTVQVHRHQSRIQVQPRALAAHGERELRGVEDLDRQAPPDLHLLLVESGVQAQARGRRPVAHRVRPVLLQQAHRGHHIALGLAHLLVVGVQDPPRQARVAPRQGPELQVGAHHRREQPRADDVLALGAQVHRVGAGEQVVVVQPAARQLRRQGGRGPRVHDVELAHEAARLAALLLRESLRRVRGRVHGQAVLRGRDDGVVVDLAVGAHPVPQREGHAEEPLARHQPVALEAPHPVLVAHAHEIRVELQLAAPLHQFVVEVGSRGGPCPGAAAVADVPLAGGDDLQGLVALLEEVRLADRLGGLALELAAAAQARHHGLAGRERRLARDLREGRPAGLRGDPLGRVGDDAPVLAQDRAQRQAQVAPPVDVRGVAEGAAHGDARALVLLSGRVGQDGHLDAVDGGGHRLAEERLVALVVRVGDQRHARGEQLGAGRLHAHVGAVLHGGARPRGLGGGRGVREVEGDAVVEARVLAGLQLGLGDRRLEGHVPQARRLRLVRLAARQVAQERRLGDLAGAPPDRLVVLLPVHAEPQVAPQGLELGLVLDGEALAQLHEVAARDGLLVAGLDGLALAAHVRRLEVGVVGQRRVHADPEVVLHAPLGGQPVVVPPHRVEHRPAPHALEAGDDIGVRVGEDVADVQ